MKRYTPTLFTALGLIFASGGISFAQDTQDASDDQVIEQVFVTGTLIGRQTGNISSPIAIIDTEDILASGAGTIADLIQNLTINTGAQNYTDAFTQNVSTGTSNINLRGLGVSSTLVLLNGNRQVVSGAPTDNGLLFVDTSSLVPLIAIGRIEILEDGATTTYGSDAVAGVVNFITRNNFEGLELSVGAQSITGESQLDINVEGIFGIGNNRTHFMASFGYLHRTPLTTAERRFPGSFDPVNGDFSNAGQPGAFIVPYLPTELPAPLAGFLDLATYQFLWTSLFDSGGGVIPNVADFFEPLLGQPSVPGAIPPVLTDPNCAVGENSVVPSTFPFGFCRLDFGSYFDLVAKEERILGYMEFSHDLSDTVSFALEVSAARNRATRNNSPSFPIPAAQTMLVNNPASLTSFYNPFNPFGISQIIGVDITLPIFFIGRTIGQGPPAPSTHDSDTYRVFAGFDGDFGSDGNWQINFVHAQNKFYLRVDDVLKNEFSLALNGLGGPACNPLTTLPGTGGCQFFNPFGSALIAAPGDTVPGPFGGQVPVANDPALIAWFTDTFTQDYDSRLTVVDAIVSNSFTAVLDQPIQYAIGVQYRKVNYDLTRDANSNADNYLFLVGGQDFTSSLGVFAIFGELDIPLGENVDLLLALRYEKYNQGVGDTLDPKIGIIARPTDSFSVRGTFGTSFRAPNGFQLFGSQTSVQQLTDTLPGQPTTPQFFPVRTTGTGSLVPETSTAFNFGFTWDVSNNFSIDIDYWIFDFKNIIVEESAQAIINANPLDPRITRSLVTGGIVIVNTNFVNASSLKTTGFDITAEYLVPMDKAGDLRFGFDATHIIKYDLVDPQAGAVKGAGNRNFNNFGTSTPQWRFVGSAGWSYKQSEVYVFVRYISSYTDDQNNVPIESHTTVDLQYNFFIGDKNDENNWRLSVGVINIFNNFPPTVLTNQGFDTKVHDPRGRMVYGRIIKGF